MKGKEKLVIDTDLLKESIDLERVIGYYLPSGLKRVGPDAVGLCPFHVEKTPSFRVHVRRRTGLPDWKCFGCGLAGDIIKFVQLVEGIDFKGAVEILTTQFNGDPRSMQTSTSISRQKAAAEWFDQQIQALRALAHCYGIAMELITQLVRDGRGDHLIDTYHAMQRDLVLLEGARQMHCDHHLQDAELRQDNGLIGEVLRYGMNGYAVAAEFDMRGKTKYIEPIRSARRRLKAARIAVRIATIQIYKAATKDAHPEIAASACESLGELPDVIEQLLHEVKGQRQTIDAIAIKVLGDQGGRGNTGATKGYRQGYPRGGKPQREHYNQPVA